MPRIIHDTLSNGSGLNRMATAMCIAERAIGLDSVLYYTDGGKPLLPPEVPTVALDEALKSDIHVVHSCLPTGAKGKVVFIPHGTPEHCFTMTVEQMQNNYCGGDSWMLSTYFINRADAVVTFWPRHQAIWQTIAPKQKIHVAPMGVDKSFWKPMPTRGKWSGSPACMVIENGHAIKWPLDVFLAWPFIMKEMDNAILHAHYLPHNMHRFWYPLLHMNGTAFKSYSSAMYFGKEDLRNAFCSVDYLISPVRYGDHNTLCMEAKASGAKVISYRGNEYADYWITEGSQVEMAKELVSIFKSKAESRTALEVPDIAETAQFMKGIYEGI